MRAATLAELAIEQRAWINLPIPSSSCRYSAVAFLMQSGSFSPSVTYFRKPFTAQARIPGDSAFSLSGRLWSILSSAIRTVNGINRMRRQMPSSVPRMFGLWLVESHSLKCGSNSKCSPYKNLAVTVSPPVDLFHE